MVISYSTKSIHALRRRVLEEKDRTLSAADKNTLLWAATHYLKDKAPARSAHQRLSRRQWKIAFCIVFSLVVYLLIAPIATVIFLNTLFIAHCLVVLGLRATLLYLSATGKSEPRRNSELLPHKELPVITILCPLYQEAKSLPGLIGALKQLEYPADKLDIKILLEIDDNQTIARATALNLPAQFSILLIPQSEPRTKPKACNYALWLARGSLVVIYDAEDRPSPDQLHLAATEFASAPDQVCCLQARLNYYNRGKSIITRLFAIEYALLFDLILPGLDRIGAPLPLGGTSNIFKTEMLIRVGGWDAHNVTEDADLGLRMAQAGYTTRMLDSTTYEEATQHTQPWLRQRSRWIKGYIQTWLVHGRKTMPERPWPFHLTLHFLVGSVVIAAILNPIYWALYIFWLSGAGWVTPLFPPPLGGIATFALLAGNLFHIWVFMLAPMRRQWHDLVPYALLAPAYWALQSLAGYKALWQFVYKPFYWEKTNHGQGQSIEKIVKTYIETPTP